MLETQRIPVQINFHNGCTVRLRTGRKSELLKQVTESFLRHFGSGAEILSMANSKRDDFQPNTGRMAELQIAQSDASPLADVVAYCERKNLLMLVQAVTTTGVFDDTRRQSVASRCIDCTANVVYVSAFQNRLAYSKFASDIAWETEVWIADAPEHMIHFNGDKFLGPYR